MRVGYALVVVCLLAMPPAAAPDETGTVTGSVRFRRGSKDATSSDGYVYLVPIRKGRQLPPKPVTATIVQKGRRFTPNLIVIPVGSTVWFPNSESASSGTEHNVFSPNPPPFDLDHYGRGVSKSRKFLDEGDYDIYCDIHVEMSAKVKVVDGELIAQIVNGTFKLTGVPAGKYKVVAWAPDSVESKETIDVAAGATVQVPQINVVLGDPKLTHKRKNGDPYDNKYRKP